RATAALVDIDERQSIALGPEPIELVARHLELVEAASPHAVRGHEVARRLGVRAVDGPEAERQAGQLQRGDEYDRKANGRRPQGQLRHPAPRASAEPRFEI